MKCPHCGQSVQAMGSTCPLCQQDLGSPSTRPRLRDADHPKPPRLSGEELAALEQYWAERSDEALEDAAYKFLDYTEDGQRVIRDELRRRNRPLPEREDDEGDTITRFLTNGVQVYSRPGLYNPLYHLELQILEAALEAHGITCKILSTRLDGASDRLVDSPMGTGLWVLDRSKEEQARQVVEEALEPLADSTPWVCPQCLEENDGAFSECWNCGSERALGSAD